MDGGGTREFGRAGFEYRYCLCSDGGMNPPRFHEWAYGEEVESPRIVFETQTRFIVQGRLPLDHRKIIEHERFSTALLENSDRGYSRLEVTIGRRLKDYWMSDDEIGELLGKASAFGRESVANRVEHSDEVVIGIKLDVYTVQGEGEPMDAAIDRAIRPQHLFPIHICPWYVYSCPSGIKKEDNICEPEVYQFEFGLCIFLRDVLHRVRVGEDGGGASSLMEECPICLRNPTLGAQISSLHCGHTFHHHCLVRWLVYHNSCPICRRQAHDVSEEDDIDNEFTRKFIY